METVRTPDGLALHVQHWAPASLPPRGRVILVHGLGEHVGRYEHVARALATDGLAVTGYDHRGHGRSPGPRGDVPMADSLCADLACVIDAQPRDGLPWALLGHSLGGLVAARFVAEALAPQPAPWSRTPDALVLSSPALDPGMNGFQKGLLAVMSRLAPHVAVNNGLKTNWISRDAAVVKAYEQDPRVHDRVSAQLVRFIVDGGAFVQAQAPRWRVPTLLMWAGADRCVAPRGSAAFAAAAPAAVLRAREWPGLFHEIFNEPEREQVLVELRRWLGERLTRRQAAAA